MPNLIRQDGIHTDNWTIVHPPAEGEAIEIPEGPALLPAAIWKDKRQELTGRNDIGFWLDSHEEPEDLADYVNEVPVIGVNFPKFSDGRGYSIARLLRERFGFRNELRAVGDVLLDQLFYMKRCGFDAYALREDKNPDDAEYCLNVFSHAYQGAVDDDTPLFRRRWAS
ncbi:oxidoreductase [Tamilnaduibacter salinus]|uniref:Oxidoreductase n=1 Tax=Tamilnaduibacter salinus TaxID=1484056 RepID=A0A2A2I451_9GAMM|nr:DUF934 domain-containing protein [Tamilnaduibacter salinus]PAV26372.1 oxidoreductase [Tamilnaduibacter salinus]